jgi:undecaprenyl diphosphate synthase
MFFKKLKRVRPENIPAHVAVIMDGNGRWAKKRGLPRSAGHQAGADAVERLVDVSVELGIRYISIYAFSTENWSRPKAEINSLWKILDAFFKAKLPVLHEKGVRIVHSGSRSKLPSKVLSIIENAEHITEKNRKITLNLCLNYGGRQEIVDSVNEWMKGRKKNELISADKIRKHLYQPGIPDADLVIRTSGESRISNFLLWQIAYSEFVFMDVLWPDFGAEHAKQAIAEYQKRTRRFGGI